MNLSDRFHQKHIYSSYVFVNVIQFVVLCLICFNLPSTFKCSLTEKGITAEKLEKSYTCHSTLHYEILFISIIGMFLAAFSFFVNLIFYVKELGKNTYSDILDDRLRNLNKIV